MLKLYERCKSLDEMRKETLERSGRKYPVNEYALYFSTLFVTGGRVSEVIELQPTQFYWNDEILYIRNMVVEKKRRLAYRDVIIERVNNPLTEEVIRFVSECTTDYLFPGYENGPQRELNPLKHATRQYVRKVIIGIDDNIWPHWCRDQRSWHLSTSIERGGLGFEPFLLRSWFSWSRMETTLKYAGRRDEEDVLRKFGALRVPAGRSES